MALATEEEWETDPELKAMRAEFVASFAVRRVALESLLSVLRAGRGADASFEEALKNMHVIAHKLSGAAETYGFPTLTRASSALEDWVDLHEGRTLSVEDGAQAAVFAELLAGLLSEAQLAAKDVKEPNSVAAIERLEAAVRALQPR